MSTFLMTTWAGAGNTPPMASVAGALARRGHVVRVMGDELLRGEFEAAGASFIPWKRAPQRTAHGRDGDVLRDWEPKDPAKAIERLRDGITVGPAADHAADVTEQLRLERPDVLLCEQLLLGPLVAAEAAGVPAVVLNPTVDVVPAPGRPPFGFGLLPASSPDEQEQHAQLAAMAMRMWDGALPALNRARADHGLAPLEHTLDQGRSAALVLVMTSAAFDFPGEVPPVVRYVGPRLDDAAWARDEPWQEPAGDGPLVLVSLSSDFQDQGDLLQRIADALGTLPLRAVLTTGQGIDPGVVVAPANVSVLRAAPHGKVLRRAQLCVTHCGHGTTLKALAAGVPLVCLPMGRDQHDIAARVVAAGAGVRVDAGASPAVIAAAVRQVLHEPRFRERAGELSAAIARETAEDRAVAELESLLAVPASASSRPHHRAAAGRVPRPSATGERI